MLPFSFLFTHYLSLIQFQGRGLLHHAALYGGAEAIDLILASPVEKWPYAANPKDHLDWTPLHCAASKNKIEEAAALIKAKADLSAKHMMGRAPLHVAAEYDSVLVAQQLLNASAHVGLEDSTSATALHIASQYNKPNVIELLISKKANLTLTLIVTIMLTVNIILRIHERQILQLGIVQAAPHYIWLLNMEAATL